MQFHVLGPIGIIDDDGSSIALVSAAQRRLMAMLILRAGTTVSADYLGEYLELSPGALRTAVSRLRRVIGLDRVVTVPPGYLVRAEHVDARSFEESVRSVRAEASDVAIPVLERALAMWSGAPYEEFADEEWAVTEANRLVELKCAATENLAEHLLAVGEYDRAIQTLGELVGEHPLRDRPRGQLMRAYAGAGRQAEALRVFRDYRSYLLAEIGSEPSAAVVAIDRQIASAGASGMSNDSTGAERPTGVVTFLFTDIEASTSMWDIHPIEMDVAVERHHDLLIGEVSKHDGVVFATGGDGFAAAFADPESAVAAAVAAQRFLAAEDWPEPLRIRVRMGIHTGMSYERGGDYFGPTPNTAARVMSAGRGMQVLLSGTSRQLLRDTELPVGTSIRPHGDHQLVGINEPVAIFEIRIDELEPVDMPLRSQSLTQTTLPTTRTRLIGRAAELEHADRLLQSNRVVTIVGPAGCGKSLLALTVAHHSVGLFDGGLFHADLAAVDDADTLVSSVGRSLRLQPSGGDATEALLAECSGRRLLLVLDNGEHLADEIAELADRMLDVPGPSLLVTSRARLEVVGEAVLNLGPLERGDGAVSDAAQLFIDRAVEGGADLTLDDDAVAEIEELVDRLDRLPLAIELAASNVVFSSPHQLRRDLDRGAVMRAARRSSRRWSTVEEMVEWSYDLLDPVSQSLLRVMSPCRGPTPLEAIAEMWPTGASADVVQPLLAELVRLNLVRVEPGVFGVRYSLLETVRDFAQRRAVDAQEFVDAGRRHRNWFLQWSERPPVLERAATLTQALVYEEQVGNLRAALGFSAASGEVRLMARQTWSIAAMWWMTGRDREGLEWLQRSEPAIETESDEVIHQLIRMAAALTVKDWKVFFDARERCLVLAEQPSDEVEALALGLCGVAMINDPEGGLALIDRALATLPEHSALCRQILQNFAGEISLSVGRPQDALTRYAEFDVVTRDRLDPWWKCVALVNQAVAALVQGDVEAGAGHARSALETAQASDLTLNTSGVGAAIAHATALAFGQDLQASATVMLDLRHQLRASTRVEERLRSLMHGTAFLAILVGDGVAADALYSYLKASGISIPWQVALFRRGQELRGVPAPRHTPIEFERASEIELAVLRRMQGLGPESAFTLEHVGP